MNECQRQVLNPVSFEVQLQDKASCLLIGSFLHTSVSAASF